MPTDPPEGYVSSADACRALGISDRTLRRRVQAGTLAGEYVARPQGSVLYVKLPDGYAAPQAAAGGTPRKPDEIAEETEETHAATLAAQTALFLDRLDTAQAALLSATERAVRAEAERDAARQAAEAARAEAEALKRRGWWARLWNW